MAIVGAVLDRSTVTLASLLLDPLNFLEDGHLSNMLPKGIHIFAGLRLEDLCTPSVSRSLLGNRWSGDLRAERVFGVVIDRQLPSRPRWSYNNLLAGRLATNACTAQN